MDRLKNLNLLFLEDNEEFAKNTKKILSIHFKKVFQVNSIKDATQIMNDYKVDVIISDIKLTDGNGLDFIQRLRRNNDETPAVILSSYRDEKLLLRAIPLNLLSYKIKPLSYDNFMLLLNDISFLLTPKDIYTISNNISYNSSFKELRYKNKKIMLTKQEILFLEYILKNKHEIISHEMIQINIWENKLMSDSGIKNLILRLRKKVDEEFIVNVQGVGYKLANYDASNK